MRSIGVVVMVIAGAIVWAVTDNGSGTSPARATTPVASTQQDLAMQTNPLAVMV
jgi:hypothetical protein